jgi:hypothetical protein
MQQASWTYELPQTGSAAENLEDYEARASDGEHLGVVTGLVERAGELYVLVDAGRMPPFVHRRCAVRLEDVAEVDHGALVVVVAGERAWLDEHALALEPANARRGPDAEAVRVHELPRALALSMRAGNEGPVDRGGSLLVLAAGTLSAYTLFVVVALWATRGLAGWEYIAFGLPLLLALLGVAAAGYELYREPHAGHRPRVRAAAS